MRALYKAAPGAGLELVDRPEPRPGPGEIKIRVHRTGICGTDLHIESWDAWASSEIKAPLIPGHEFYGEVVELGEHVERIGVGDRVSGEGHIVCGHCRNCLAGRRQMCGNTSSVGVHRDGAFAEFVVIPASNAWRHDPTISADLGAVFDPFGNAVHTALAYPLVGEDVLITGAGPIGLMTTALVRQLGARRVAITDVSPQRLAIATSLGADAAVDVSTSDLKDVQQSLGLREGFDVGLEMSGHPSALPMMIENLRHGAKIALLGLPSEPVSIDWGTVVTHMLSIRGIYGREMFETWHLMSALLESNERLHRDLESVVTDRIPASDWSSAFALARAGTRGKIVIDWLEG